MSRKGLHSIGQMGEGRQGEEERQFLALSQVLGSGAGFWHCLLVSLGLGGEGCGVGVLADGEGAGDSLLAAGFFPLDRGPLAMVKIPGEKQKRILLASCLCDLLRRFPQNPN